MAIQPMSGISVNPETTSASSSTVPFAAEALSTPSAGVGGYHESDAAADSATASVLGSTNGSRTNRPVGIKRKPNYKLAQTIYAHKRAVTALKWTADGRMLVSAGADGYVHLFSMTTTVTTTPTSFASSSTQPTTSTTSSLSHYKTLRCHRSGINAISLSPDDLYLATASDDGTARIYALPSPHLPTLPSQHATSHEGEEATEAAPSTNTSRMATPLRTLQGHTAPILSLAFSPRSNLLVTGSFDESAIVWDVRTGLALKKLPAHSEAVWTTGWDREGGVVLTGSADGLVRLWDASSGQCLKTLDNESNSPVTCALFTPNPFYLMTATASPETTVRVYNIHTARVVKTLRPEGENGAQVSLGLATGATAGERMPVICAFTHAPTRSRAMTRLPSPGNAHEAANGQEAAEKPARAAAGEDVNMDSDRAQLGDTDGPAQKQSASTRTTQTPDTWVLAGTDKGGIIVWDLATRALAQVMEGHMASVLALAVHPNGAWVASGSAEPERTIRVWKHVDE